MRVERGGWSVERGALSVKKNINWKNLLTFHLQLSTFIITFAGEITKIVTKMDDYPADKNNS